MGVGGIQPDCAIERLSLQRSSLQTMNIGGDTVDLYDILPSESTQGADLNIAICEVKIMYSVVVSVEGCELLICMIMNPTCVPVGRNRSAGTSSPWLRNAEI